MCSRGLCRWTASISLLCFFVLIHGYLEWLPRCLLLHMVSACYAVYWVEQEVVICSTSAEYAVWEKFLMKIL